MEMIMNQITASFTYFQKSAMRLSRDSTALFRKILRELPLNDQMSPRPARPSDGHTLYGPEHRMGLRVGGRLRERGPA
eukprot:15033498-Alexandrium_andersonii.AAC.1